MAKLSKPTESKRTNPVAKDLRTPKYRLRVIEIKTTYKRKVKHVKAVFTFDAN